MNILCSNIVAELERVLVNAQKEASKLTNYVRGKTKQPAISADVVRIVTCIPQGYRDREREASLFFTALETGARAMTVGAGKPL